MSAVAASGAVTVSDARPGVMHLGRIELRKMVDTRAGFWLPIGIGGIIIATALISALAGPAEEHTLARIFHNTLQPAAFLLPVIGVLLVASEFSQRTALTTFTLVPNRSRVLVGKLIASVIFSVAAALFCLLVAVGATALSHGDGSHTWHLPLVVIPQALLFLATAMITGVAFGAAVLVSAPAIVVYLLLPTVWGAIVSSIHALSGAADWLDSSRSLAPMAQQPLSATHWAHAAATLVVWTGVPLAIGWWRILHRDID